MNPIYLNLTGARVIFFFFLLDLFRFLLLPNRAKWPKLHSTRRRSSCIKTEKYHTHRRALLEPWHW